MNPTPRLQTSPTTTGNMQPAPRYLYVKGGDVAGELDRLLHRRGEMPVGGPDQYMLALLGQCGLAPVLFMSLGDTDRSVDRGQFRAVQWGARPARSSRSAKWAYGAAMLRFMRAILGFKPTVVFCGIEGPFAVMLLGYCRLLRLPFVYFSHCALDTPAMTALYRCCNWLVVKGAHRIVANGPYLSSEAIRLGAPAERVVEFNVGLDTHDADQIAILRATLPKRALVLFAGRVEEDKGALDLLDAFAQLPRDWGVELHYLGGGGALEALRERARRAGLEAVVQVHGEVPYHHVLSAMCSAALVATPSQSRFPEGRCKTAIEAFWCGTPVLAPNYGPFPSVLDDGRDGLLYRPDDVADMAAAMRRCFASPELLARLTLGATASGERLRTPTLSFRDALRSHMVSVA